jgi:phosphate transport system substrate-binding protein
MSLYVRLLILAATALAFASAHADTLRGSGSTFAADLYTAWSHRLKAANIELAYDAVGSSAGVKQVVSHDVDFGASDRPLNRHELDASSLAQFPTAAGAVVVSVNIPGVRAEQLTLNGSVLAGLYLGRIHYWNDGEITALNPGLKLPALAVVPLIRTAGSGTSFALTSYLSKASEQFASLVGPTSDMHAPDARVVPSNQAAAAMEQATPGAIAYFDFSYALAHHVPTVALINHWGARVIASDTSVQDAVRLSDWSKLIIDQNPTFAIDLTDAECPTCWPISTLTYVLVPTTGPVVGAERAIRFFQAALDDGDAAAKEAGYVPLPTGTKWRVKIAMRKWVDELAHRKQAAIRVRPTALLQRELHIASMGKWGRVIADVDQQQATSKMDSPRMKPRLL